MDFNFNYISLFFIHAVHTSQSIFVENMLVSALDSITAEQSRQKRQFDDGGRCLFDCIDQMREGMGRLGLSQSHQSSFMQMPVLTNQTIREYCTIYREGKDCLNDCPSTEHSDAVQIGFAGSDYMCVQKLDEFIQYLSCYKRAEGRIKTYCDAGCEGGSTDFSELHENTVRGRIENHPQTSLDSMNDACRLIGCQLSCQAPVIVEYCDNNHQAATLLEEFAARSWKAMRRIHIRQQNLASNPLPFPKYCDAVADSDFQKLAPVQHTIDTHVEEINQHAQGFTNVKPEQVMHVSNVDSNYFGDHTVSSSETISVCYINLVLILIFNYMFSFVI